MSSNYIVDANCLVVVQCVGEAGEVEGVASIIQDQDHQRDVLDLDLQLIEAIDDSVDY